jgi:uncharacterized membrane protein
MLMNKKKLGIAFIYAAAVLIMLSILFLFNLIRFRFAYTTAAFGFLLYIIGILLTREGRLTAYRIAMVVVSVALIGVAIVREVF